MFPTRLALACLGLVAMFAGAAQAQPRPGLAYDELKRPFTQRECLDRIEAAAISLRLDAKRGGDRLVWGLNDTDTVLMVCDARADATYVKVIVAASDRDPAAVKDELVRLIDLTVQVSPAPGTASGARVEVTPAAPEVPTRLASLRERLTRENFARLYADLSVALARHGALLGWMDGADSQASPYDPIRGVQAWEPHYRYVAGGADNIADVVAVRLEVLRSGLPQARFAELQDDLRHILSLYGA